MPATPLHPPDHKAAPKVYLETFGCQMNVLDSQLVTDQLRHLGYRFTQEWREADVVLYNTCSVREHAEQKVWSRIGEVGVHKRDPDAGRADVILGVIGCMAERDGEEMLRRHPQIDLLCGPGELDKVPLLIHNAMATRLDDRGGHAAAHVALQGNTHRRSATRDAATQQGDDLELLDLSRSFASASDSEGGNRSAYVRITRGCNKFCTYCVVPRTRGREVHRPPDHIVDEVRRLAAAGVVEVTLLGQTVNHYHFDAGQAVTVRGVTQPQVGSIISPNRGTGGPSPTFNATTTSFADLLRRIHDEVPDLPRLRFVTSFPRDFGDDILAAIADCPRICRYLHLPVQSGSDRMLRAMNRGYTIAEYMDLIDRVRDYLPDAELATDIICGFPGETEADHRATADLIERCRFKNAFIFKYSPRPGTAAHDRLADDIPDEIKKRRNNDLLAIQNRVSATLLAGYVNRRVSVFVEGVSAKTRKQRNAAANTQGPAVTLGWERPEETTQLTGRTGGDLIVCFDGDESLVGRIVDIDITAAAPLALLGRYMGEELATETQRDREPTEKQATTPATKS